MKAVVLLLFLVALSAQQQKALIELLGMGDLLKGLAVIRQSKDPFGEPSIAYLLDPRVNVFLRQFTTRTSFCDYKCPSFFNVPCFLLFGCNIQLRNFFLLFFVPIVTVVISGACCGRRVWRFGCWMRYLGVFTGIILLIWFCKRISKAAAVRKRRQERVKELQGQTEGYEIEPPNTTDRLASKMTVTHG